MADEKLKEGQQPGDEGGATEETKGGANQGIEEEPGGSNNHGGEGGSGGNTQAEKTFTQEQVNKMMAREKNQGRAAALRELGIDPKDSKAMAMIKALVDSQKTDEQKAAEKAAEDNKKQQETERRAIVAEIKAEAMMLNAQPQFVDDLVALVVNKMGDGDDAKDVKSIVSEYKTKYPAWFKEDDSGKDGKDGKGNKGKAGQRGTGSSVKSNSGGKDGSEPKGLGARLAAQRKASSSKSSFWGNTKR